MSAPTHAEAARRLLEDGAWRAEIKECLRARGAAEVTVYVTMRRLGIPRDDPPTGERRYNSRLTDAARREIVRRIDAGESQRSIARSYNVHRSAILRVISRRDMWVN